MKSFIILISLILSGYVYSSAQDTLKLKTHSGFYLTPNIGYDLPSFTKSYQFYEIKGGFKLGLDLGYNLPNGFGIGLDYDYIINNPSSSLNSIYFDTLVGKTPSIINKNSNKLIRHFIGIGPQYTFPLGSNKMGVRLYSRAGIGILNGGEILMSTPGAIIGEKDYHLMFNGFNKKQFSYKIGGNLNYKISKKFGIRLGVYHIRYLSVTPDNFLSLDNVGNQGIVYGASPLESFKDGYLLTDKDANVIREGICSSCSSTGVDFGLIFTFGTSSRPKICSDCGCPNDGHSVIVNVEDGPSKKIISGADVAIKDLNGNIVATGTTNTFGAIEFVQLPHGNYTVVGNVFGIETTITTIYESEFLPNGIIQKKIFYEDLRFILKGRVINKKTQAPEPNVVVNLTNFLNKNVEQDNSNGKGEFSFRLDKESSYEIVGIKENKLSDIDRASTVGLVRSTTLFVELKLGVENFDCGQGTVLDIKYDYDKWNILPESKFDLDKLIRYMNDHKQSRVELSSHTDSRGKNDYNQDLSQKRAQSAVDYILGRGIEGSRIIANGYGEERHLNRCRDGVSCSEEEHRINRRTEAKLLCN